MPAVTAPQRHRLVLLLVAALAAALGGLVTSAAQAVSPAPVAIVVDQIVGESLTGLGDLPNGAQPTAFVQAGDLFGVDVSFHDTTGALASFNNDVTLRITGTTNNGAAVLDPATVVVPKGNSTYRLSTSIADAANQVVLTVAIDSKKPSTVASGVSFVPGVKDLRFDVASDALTVNGDANLAQGIGGDANCTNATRAAPVCAIVQLPRGAGGAQVLLSVGACDTDTDSAYAPCFAGPKGVGGAIVQTLFAQPGELPYTAASPATVVVKCDKTLCGTGSIQNLKLAFSFSGAGNLVDAAPCPAKGVAIAATTDPDGNFVPAQACVDYVQSKRDGSGDTHLYLNTPGDLRVGVG